MENSSQQHYSLSPERNPSPILPLRINLSTEPYGFIRMIQFSLLIVSCALVFVFGAGIKQFQDLNESTERFQDNFERVLVQQNALRATFEGGLKDSSGEQVLLSEVAFANDLLVLKSFSWTSFFSHLEGAVPSKISLSKLQPQPKGKGVQIEGRALSLKHLTQFILGLEKSPHFNTIFLANQKKDKEGIIEFTITFEYEA